MIGHRRENDGRAHPDGRHALMTLNRLSLLEVQVIGDGPIISVPLFCIFVARRQMCCDETDCCVMVFQPDTHCALVSRHSPETSLSGEQESD